MTTNTCTISTIRTNMTSRLSKHNTQSPTRTYPIGTRPSAFSGCASSAQTRVDNRTCWPRPKICRGNQTSECTSLRVLMTRARRIEVVRILLTGLIALLFWRQWIPLQILWLAVAIGLYPLVKTGVTDLIRERKVGTEIFVTVATLVAVFGGETVAGAVLMVIILIAEFIADLNMDRARASIKTLIGSVPQVALMRGADGERVVPIEQSANRRCRAGACR